MLTEDTSQNVTSQPGNLNVVLHLMSINEANAINKPLMQQIIRKQ